MAAKQPMNQPPVVKYKQTGARVGLLRIVSDRDHKCKRPKTRSGSAFLTNTTTGTGTLTHTSSTGGGLDWLVPCEPLII